VQKNLTALLFDHNVVRFGVFAPKPLIQKDCRKTLAGQGRMGKMACSGNIVQVYHASGKLWFFEVFLETLEDERQG